MTYLSQRMSARWCHLSLCVGPGLRFLLFLGFLSLIPVWNASAQIIETFVGAGPKAFGGDGVPATESGLNEPNGIVFDASGRLVIADSQNHRIRYISGNIIGTLVGTGVAGWEGSATQATQVQINTPIDVTTGPEGSYVYSDAGNHRIRRVDRNGVVATLVGDGTPAVKGDGLIGPQASVFAPIGLVFDATGRLFWADKNRVRVLANNRVWTIAGTGDAGYGGDGGSATDAVFNNIRDLAVRRDGAIFVADTGNHRVRLIDPSWRLVSTYAGTGIPGYNGDNILASKASLNAPVALAIDSQNRLVIADSGNRRVRRVRFDGTIETLYWSAVTTQTFMPSGLAIDATGDIYFSQAGVHVIRYNMASAARSATGAVFAGVGVPTYGGDGMAAGKTLLVTPSLMVLDSKGRLVFTDTGAHRVRRLDLSGTVSTIAGSGIASGTTTDGSPATQARMVSPMGLGYDATGNLFVAEYGSHVIRMVSPSQEVFRVVGSGSRAFVDSGTKAVLAALNSPWGLVVDSTGQILFADRLNHRVRRAILGATVSTIVGDGTATYAGDGRRGILASLNSPTGLSLTATGELLIADEKNNRIRVLSATGTVYTIVGNGTAAFSGDGKRALSASLNRPRHAVTDATGNIYIADTLNHRVRKVSTDGRISTVAGTGTPGYGGDGGQAIHARLNQPSGLLIDQNGDLLIADSGNSRIRRVNFRQLDPALVNLPGRVFANMPGSATLSILDSGNGFVLPGRVRAGGRLRADMTLLDRSFATAPLVVSVSWQNFAGKYVPGTLLVNGKAAPVSIATSSGITFSATSDERSLADVSLTFLVGDATSSAYSTAASLGTVAIVDATDPGAGNRSITSQHAGNLFWTKSPAAGVVSTTVEVDNTPPAIQSLEILVSHDNGATYRLLDFPSVGDSDILLVSATVRSDSLSLFRHNVYEQFNVPTLRFGTISSGTAMLVSSTTGSAIFSATVSAHALDHPLPITPKNVVLKLSDVLGNQMERDVGAIGVKAFGPSVITSYLIVNGHVAPEGTYLTGPDHRFDSVAELGAGDEIQLAVELGSFNKTGLERITADFSPLYPPALWRCVDGLVPSATSMSGSILTATWTYASVDLGAGGISDATFADLDTIGKTALTLSPAGLTEGVTPAAVEGVPGTPRITSQAGAIPQSATTIRVVVHDADSPFPAVAIGTQIFTMDTQPPEAQVFLHAEPPFRRPRTVTPGVPQRVKGGDHLTYVVEFTNPLISRTGDDRFAAGTSAGSITGGLSAVAGPRATAVTPTSVVTKPRPGMPTLHTARFDVTVSSEVGTTGPSSVALADARFSVYDDVGNALAVVSPATPIAVDNHPPFVNVDSAHVVLKSGFASGPDGSLIQAGQDVAPGSTLSPESELKITGTSISDPVDAALDVLTTPGAVRLFFSDGVGGTFVQTDAVISAQSVFPTFVLTVPPADALRTTRDFSIIIAASDTLGNSVEKRLRPTFTVNGAPALVLSALDAEGSTLAADAAGKTVRIPAGQQTTISASTYDIDRITEMRFQISPSERFSAERLFSPFGAVDVTGKVTIVPEPGAFLGPATVTVSVSDSAGRTTTEWITLFVDQPPSFTARTAAIYQGDRLVREISPVGDSLLISEDQRVVVTLTGGDPDPSAKLTLSASGQVFFLPEMAAVRFGGKSAAGSKDLPLLVGPREGIISASFELTPTYRTVPHAVERRTAQAVFNLSDGALSHSLSLPITVVHQPTVPSIRVSSVRVGGTSVPADQPLRVSEGTPLLIDLVGEDVSGEELTISQPLGSGIGTLVSKPSVDRVLGSFAFQPDSFAADLPEGTPPTLYDSPIDPAVLRFVVTNESGGQGSVTVQVDIVNTPAAPQLTTDATLDGRAVSPGVTPVAVVRGQKLVIRAETVDPDMDIVIIQFDAPTAATTRSLHSDFGSAASELSLTFDESFRVGETIQIAVKARDSFLSSPTVTYTFTVTDLSERLSFVFPFQGILISATGSTFISAVTEVVIQESDTLDLVVRAKGAREDKAVTILAQGTALADKRLQTALFAGKSVASKDPLPFEASGPVAVNANYRLHPGLRAVGVGQATEELSLDLTVTNGILRTEHAVRIIVRNVPTVPTVSVTRVSVNDVPVSALPRVSLDEGSNLVVLLSVDDAGAQQVSLTAAGLPPGTAELTPTSATPPFSAKLTYSSGPDSGAETPYHLVFSATNDTGGVNQASLTVLVVDRYRPPHFQFELNIDGKSAALSDPVALDTLQVFNLLITGVDPDPNESLILSVSGTALAAPEFQIADFAGQSVKAAALLPFKLSGPEPTGTLSILPGAFANLPGEPARTYAIELGLTDGIFNIERVIELAVTATSAPPVIRVSAASVDGVSLTPTSHLQISEGQILSGTVTAIDPVGLNLVLSAEESQGLARVQGASGTNEVSGSFLVAPGPVDSASSPVRITFRANNERGESSQLVVAVDVRDVDYPARATCEFFLDGELRPAADVYEATEGHRVTLVGQGWDPDHVAVILAVVGAPPDSEIQPAVGLAHERGARPATIRVTFVPKVAGEIIDVTFVASDSLADGPEGDSSTTARLLVKSSNRPPILSLEPSALDPVRTGETVNLMIFVDDPEGDPVTLSAYFDGRPLAAGRDGFPLLRGFYEPDTLGASLVFQPDREQAGEHLLTIEASDGQSVTRQAVLLRVIDAGLAPTPTPTPTPQWKPGHMVLSQGDGGSTVNKLVRVSDLRRVTSFSGLPKKVAELLGSPIERSVNATVADIDGDGVQDIVVGFGPGGLGSTSPSIIVAWTPTGGVDDGPRVIASRGAFWPQAINALLRNPHGAVNLTSGNFVGDQLPMIVAAQGLGGSKQIRVLRYVMVDGRGKLEIIGSFQGLAGASVWGYGGGGTAVAAGDVDGDGLDELIVGQMNGPGARALFQVLNLKKVGTQVQVADRSDPVEGMEAEYSGLGGINMAVGDIDGDGQNEIIVGTAGIPDGANSLEFKNFIRAFDVAVDENHKITAITPVPGMMIPIQVFQAAVNPSGGIDIAAGNLDEDPADELLVGTQAIIAVDQATGLVTVSYPAPKALVKAVNMEFAADGTFLRLSPAVPQFQAFGGAYAPTSGAVNAEIYPNGE